MSSALWVTGVGLVTPLGVGVEATWNRLVAGDCAIRPIGNFAVDGQRSTLAAEVDEVTTGGRGWSRTSGMAALAAGEALEMAGLDVHRFRVGLVLGTTTGGMFETEALLAALHADPESRQALSDLLSHPLSASADRLQERLGPFARMRTLSSACSSGANALVVATTWLQAGDVDAVVAGGADGLCRLTLTGFNALGALDVSPCRPFDRCRKGTTLGEGAGFVVLERADGARRRSARPIAALAGWASGSEAHHITNPAADAHVVASLLSQALSRAGITPADVDYVSAHGTGTPVNDPIESAALTRALGPEIERIAVSSSKGQLGHSLGAAGAVEAVITALVVQRRTLVPTTGLNDPDPACALRHVLDVGRAVPAVRAAISCAFGFGGMDAVLVFTDPLRGSTQRAAPSRSAVVTGVSAIGPWGAVSGRACARMVDPTFEGSPMDAEGCLDPVRGRRLDRPARLAVLAAQQALGDSGGDGVPTGVVFGSAFGNVDGSAAFMRRLFERGPRAASPADFPNLVPSAPAAHASIYLGLHGPAFATAELGTSGESAFVQAVQLVTAGEVARVVAGVVEPKSMIVERVLSALFSGSVPSALPAAPRWQRGAADVAAALVIRESSGVEPGQIFARVKRTIEWRDQASAALSQLEPPSTSKPEVVVARRVSDAERLVDGTPWARCPRAVCAAAGEGDGAGGIALVVAAARVAEGFASEALVIGVEDGRGYVVHLSAP